MKNSTIFKHTSPYNNYGCGGKSYLVNSICSCSEETTDTCNCQDVRFGRLEVYKKAREIADKNNITDIIDIGCGTCYKLVNNFLENRYSLYGIDYLGSLENANEFKYRVTLIQCNLSHLMSLENAFSRFDNDTNPKLLILSDVIEHINDPRPLLRTIKKILIKNENSRLVLSTPDRDVHGYNAIPYVIHGNPCHFREWNIEEFSTFMQSCGFYVEEFIQNPYMPIEYCNNDKASIRRNNFISTIVCSCSREYHQQFLLENNIIQDINKEINQLVLTQETNKIEQHNNTLTILFEENRTLDFYDKCKDMLHYSTFIEKNEIEKLDIQDILVHIAQHLMLYLLDLKTVTCPDEYVQKLLDINKSRILGSSLTINNISIQTLEFIEPDKQDITVLVTTDNTKIKYIEDLCFGLNGQSVIPYEIIFIYDESNNGDGYYRILNETIEKNLKNIKYRLIKNEENIDLTSAKNTVLSNILTKYIINISSKDIPMNDWIYNSIVALSCNNDIHYVNTYSYYFNDRENWNCYDGNDWIWKDVDNNILLNILGSNDNKHSICIRTKDISNEYKFACINQSALEDTYKKIMSEHNNRLCIPIQSFMYRKRHDTISNNISCCDKYIEKLDAVNSITGYVIDKINAQRLVTLVRSLYENPKRIETIKYIEVPVRVEVPVEIPVRVEIPVEVPVIPNRLLFRCSNKVYYILNNGILYQIFKNGIGVMKKIYRTLWTNMYSERQRNRI